MYQLAKLATQTQALVGWEVSLNLKQHSYLKT
jgi:hypothetical protein